MSNMKMAALIDALIREARLEAPRDIEALEEAAAEARLLADELNACPSLAHRLL